MTRGCFGHMMSLLGRAQIPGQTDGNELLTNEADSEKRNILKPVRGFTRWVWPVLFEGPRTPKLKVFVLKTLRRKRGLQVGEWVGCLVCAGC